MNGWEGWLDGWREGGRYVPVPSPCPDPKQYQQHPTMRHSFLPPPPPRPSIPTTTTTPGGGQERHGLRRDAPPPLPLLRLLHLPVAVPHVLQARGKQSVSQSEVFLVRLSVDVHVWFNTRSVFVLGCVLERTCMRGSTRGRVRPSSLTHSLPSPLPSPPITKRPPSLPSPPHTHQNNNRSRPSS